MAKWKEPGHKTRMQQRMYAKGWDKLWHSDQVQDNAKVQPQAHLVDPMQGANFFDIERRALAHWALPEKFSLGAAMRDEMRLMVQDNARRRNGIAANMMQGRAPGMNLGDILAEAIQKDIRGRNPDRIIQDAIAGGPLSLGGGPCKCTQCRKGFNAMTGRAYVSPTMRKQAAYRTGEGYKGWLIKHGWHILGSGFFSEVYGKEGSNRVIKVCRMAKDDMWPLFAEYAMNHPHPSIAKVHAFKRYNVGMSDEFYVAVLDKMQVTVSMAECQNRHRGLSQVTEVLSALIKGESSASKWNAVMVDAALKLMPPGTREVFDVMRETFADCRFDLHGQNWMLSADNQLVLCDPIAGSHPGMASKARSVTRLKRTMAKAA